MSLNPDDFCSSCAWPEACARQQVCQRRAQGEIRSKRFGSEAKAEAVVFYSTPSGIEGWVWDLWRRELSVEGVIS